MLTKLSKSAVKRNRNLTLHILVVISFFVFILSICLGHSSETTKGFNKKLRRLKDIIKKKTLRMNHNSALPNFGVFAFFIFTP
jgi:hypothetical protein